MKYMGSKSRIAKYIVPIIQKYIDETRATVYYEPFVGGCNIIDKINCETKIGKDINKYLIALLKHVQEGLPLYDSVSKELYDMARTAFNTKDTSKFEDWQIGNIGFVASYNGRFFDGGYAKPVYEKTKNGERYRDYYREGKDNLLNQAISLKDIIFETQDYRKANPCGCVIYCDPPYIKTKQYANAKNFDYKEFWEIMRKWANTNIVLISEQNAPDDFKCIWEQEVKRTMDNNKRVNAVEKLFIYEKEN